MVNGWASARNGEEEKTGRDFRHRIKIVCEGWGVALG